jgi:4-alpha-glucanotransferase
MTETPALDRLARLAGVETEYWDIWGNHHRVEEDAQRRILDALGFPADDATAIGRSLASIEDETWRRQLPWVTTRRIGEPATLVVTQSTDRAARRTTAAIVEEDGTYHEFPFRAADHPAAADAAAPRGLERHLVPLPVDLPCGYHVLRLDGGADETMRLIVAPLACHLPSPLVDGGRLWGLSAQLYTLRREQDWGIGDFTDLGTLTETAAELGAGLVGLNPLHALFLGQPDRASPYSPSSRLFLNPLYVDVERARATAADAGTGTSLIDYGDVTRRKLAALEAIFAEVREDVRGGDGAGAGAFRAFRDEHGERLHRFAVFEALSERFGPTPWQEWPQEFRDPRSAAVAAFAETERDRVDFHLWLQWLADTQLAAAVKAETGRLPIGLYRDLAVGCAPDGSDAWSDQDLIVQRAKIGCPPDPFNMLGQDWSVPPLHPLRLQREGYEPFAAILRANMRHAGAVRIDHVMALLHLFWIPAQGRPKDGAYVKYPFEDLLAVTALESQRNRCLVVGEDLGTVPAGFRERMAAAKALSYRVLYFEKDGARFKRPDEYPALAIACATTHDLPTLSGFWSGTDIDLKHDLGLYPSAAAEEAERTNRREDRRQMLEALADEALLPPQANGPATAAEGGSMTPVLSAALHGYLARSQAALMLVQVDDLTEEQDQINVPGTVDERPNWRRRLSRRVDELASSAVTRALMPLLAERAAGPRADSSPATPLRAARRPAE